MDGKWTTPGLALAAALEFAKSLDVMERVTEVHFIRTWPDNHGHDPVWGVEVRTTKLTRLGTGNVYRHPHHEARNLGVVESAYNADLQLFSRIDQRDWLAAEAK